MPDPHPPLFILTSRFPYTVFCALERLMRTDRNQRDFRQDGRDGLYGAIRAIAESEERGVDHFVMVSALSAEQPLEAPLAMRHYMVAKLLADQRLIDSSVSATVLRPGRLMCRCLKVSSSGYYGWRERPESRRKQSNERLLARIRSLHAESDGVFGSPRMWEELRYLGESCSRNRVARLMRDNGLRGIPQRRR